MTDKVLAKRDVAKAALRLWEVEPDFFRKNAIAYDRAGVVAKIEATEPRWCGAMIRLYQQLWECSEDEVLARWDANEKPDREAALERENQELRNKLEFARGLATGYQSRLAYLGEPVSPIPESWKAK